VRGGPILPLLRKELRDLTLARPFWWALIIVVLLTGYSYVQAAQLYGEVSKSALGLPVLARGLSPLDGIMAPTFGALYLAATFLFPFVVIRTVAAEKQADSLKLLVQLPYSTIALVVTKLTACIFAWGVMLFPCLIALAFWRASGGHIDPVEAANLILGHFLYALVIAAISLLAAATTQNVGGAGILALAVTLGFWVLDFAATGDNGLLKSLSGLSLTHVLRAFERGIFSLPAVLSSLLVVLGLVAVSGICLHPGRRVARKRGLTLAVAAAIGAAVFAATRVHVFRDATEDRRNSFSTTDEADLRALDGRLTVEVHLAAEDPRYYDFERNILGKLRRIVSDMEVVFPDAGFDRVLTGGSDEAYGQIIYSIGDRRLKSRSTSEEEVLPIIFDLAGRQRRPAENAVEYPGYPLIAQTNSAQIAFYYMLPAVVAACWWFAQHGVHLRDSRRRLEPELPRRSP